VGILRFAHSIRFRLMSLIAVLLVGTLVVVSGAGYYFAEKYLEESQNQTEQAVATTAAATIKSEMELAITQLEGLSNVARLQSGDKAQILPALQEAHQKIGRFDHTFFASLDGIAINEAGDVINNSDREYFQTVVKTQKPYVSEPFVSRTTKKQSFAVAVPVIRSGQLIGVVWGTYSPERLMPLVKTIKFKKQGYGAILDDGGSYLIHPTRPELAGTMNLRTGEIAPDMKAKLGVNASISPKLISAFKEVTEKNTRIRLEYPSTAGTSQTASLNIIPLPGGQRWILLLSTSTADANSETEALSKILIGLALGCLVVVMIIIFWTSGSFVKPIVRISKIAQDIAAGNLNILQKTIHDKSEFGQLSDNIIIMSQNLRQLVQQVQTQSHHLAASSEELTASAQQSAEASNQVAGSIAQMANGAEQQVQAVNETSAAVEQITATIVEVSGTASEMAAMVAHTVEATNNGQVAVDSAVSQMAKVGTGAKKAHSAAGELEAGSRQIEEIVALISNIAGQTNLLALNAAIEAARAGEAGRGFAVVAEEVRKLAEQSEDAAQQIKGIIGKNNSNIHNVVDAVGAAIADIEAGVQLVNTAGQGFSSIGGQVGDVAAKTKDISQALSEISTGSQRIMMAIKSVEKISRETAAEAQNVSAATEEQSASTEEIASSSQSLANLAGDLQTAVAKFRV
jgi:methyl-accepting chemotaxis protein